jgi:serine-protein kinase ATM
MTPEIVPFRLTRNVVDGMGPMGTEGVFIKAAQSSLRALKDNTNALLTILSAIANDPLYSWTINPVKAQNRLNRGEEEEFSESDRGVEHQQHAGGVDRNEAASRAIARVQEKLQGYEDGTSGEQQSIEGQIQLLVNSARDRDNLCEMFVGWAPWI